MIYNIILWEGLERLIEMAIPRPYYYIKDEMINVYIIYSCTVHVESFSSEIIIYSAYIILYVKYVHGISHIILRSNDDII